MERLRDAAKREREQRKKRESIVAACKKWSLSHKAGPMYWLRSVTKTENYHWKEQGREPISAFPYRPHEIKSYDVAAALEWIKSTGCETDLSPEDPPDYLDMVMALLLTSKRLLVPKSREMMTSWIVVGFITWMCQFFDAIEWVGQSEKDEKAQGLIRYANILYREQPDWLRARYPLTDGGKEGSKKKIEWAHSSRFIGVPQGERQIASFHPYGYFNDESAHQPDFRAAWGVADRCCKQMVGVSSAAYGDFSIDCSPHIKFMVVS